MRTRTVVADVAAASGALLLTACGPSAPAAKPAAPSVSPTHPVFSKPLDARPYAALGQTKAAKNATFTQAVTFSAKGADAVLKTTGKLDFAGGRADGSLGWSVGEGFPEGAAKALGNVDSHRRKTDQAARLVIDPQNVNYHSATADYWLRYDAADTFELDPTENTANTIKTRRGSEVAFGGTLLEVVSNVKEVKEEVLPDGGRRYRTGLEARAAYGLLHSTVIEDGLSGTNPRTRLPMTVTTDAAGRLAAAETDLSPLLSKDTDSVLAGVSGLKVKLALDGYGTSAPSAVPSADKVLPAGGSVVPLKGTKTGDCVDFGTGMPSWGYVVKMDCGHPRDGRVFAHTELTGNAYPGDKNLKAQMGDSCSAPYRAMRSAWRSEGVEERRYWFEWPPEGDWNRPSNRIGTCYILTR
ncbi:hypothetical protein [Streptomyces sp. NBC_00212]|uniref:hypothetical protein n=1 Tax=Streptomyces sp. NBC_00212 TaxID=2975684 RepID=UPI003246B6DE